MGDDPCARLFKVAELYGVDYEAAHPCDLPRALVNLYMVIRSSRPYVPVDDILADMAKHLETNPLFLMPPLLLEEEVRRDLVTEMLLSLYRKCRRIGKGHGRCVAESKALLLSTLREVVGPALLRDVADMVASMELQDLEPPIDAVEYDAGEIKMSLGMPRQPRRLSAVLRWAPVLIAIALNPALIVLGLPLGYFSLPLLGLLIAVGQARHIALAPTIVGMALAIILLGLTPTLLMGEHLLVFSWLSIALSTYVSLRADHWARTTSIALAAIGSILGLFALLTAF